MCCYDASGGDIIIIIIIIITIIIIIIITIIITMSSGLYPSRREHLHHTHVLLTNRYVHRRTSFPGNGRVSSEAQ